MLRTIENPAWSRRVQLCFLDHAHAPWREPDTLVLLQLLLELEFLDKLNQDHETSLGEHLLGTAAATASAAAPIRGGNITSASGGCTPGVGGLPTGAPLGFLCTDGLLRSTFAFAWTCMHAYFCWVVVGMGHSEGGRVA